MSYMDRTDQNPTHEEDGPRAVGVLFKMSRSDRAALKRIAAARGCETVQQYLELVAFGRETTPRPAGRPRRDPTNNVYVQESLLTAAS